jgi:carbon storage regulator
MKKGKIMLVLTRNLNEAIIIADCIQVKVLGVHFNKVKLGINAPINIRILREELYMHKKIKSTNDYHECILLDESNDVMRV